MNKLKIEIIFSVLTYGSLIIFWVQNEKVNIQHLFCCPPLTDVQYLWLKKITTIGWGENICFQEVAVIKRKYLEAVEVENMEGPPGGA